MLRIGKQICRNLSTLIHSLYSTQCVYCSPENLKKELLITNINKIFIPSILTTHSSLLVTNISDDAQYRAYFSRIFRLNCFMTLTRSSSSSGPVHATDLLADFKAEVEVKAAASMAIAEAADSSPPPTTPLST